MKKVAALLGVGGVLLCVTWVGVVFADEEKAESSKELSTQVFRLVRVGSREAVRGNSESAQGALNAAREKLGSLRDALKSVEMDPLRQALEESFRAVEAFIKKSHLSLKKISVAEERVQELEKALGNERTLYKQMEKEQDGKAREVASLQKESRKLEETFEKMRVKEKALLEKIREFEERPSPKKAIGQIRKVKAENQVLREKSDGLIEQVKDARVRVKSLEKELVSERKHRLSAEEKAHSVRENFEKRSQKFTEEKASAQREAVAQARATWQQEEHERGKKVGIREAAYEKRIAQLEEKLSEAKEGAQALDTALVAEKVRSQNLRAENQQKNQRIEQLKDELLQAEEEFERSEIQLAEEYRKNLASEKEKIFEVIAAERTYREKYRQQMGLAQEGSDDFPPARSQVPGPTAQVPFNAASGSPSDARMHARECLQTGTAYFRQGRQDLAVQAFHEAIDVDPEYADAHFNLAYVYHTMGAYEFAFQGYERTLKLNPSDGGAHKGLAILYDGPMPDSEKALFHFRKFLDLQPNSPDAGDIRKRVAELGKEVTETLKLRN